MYRQSDINKMNGEKKQQHARRLRKPSCLVIFFFFVFIWSWDSIRLMTTSSTSETVTRSSILKSKRKGKESSTVNCSWCGYRSMSLCCRCPFVKKIVSTIIHSAPKSSSHHFIFHENVYLLTDIYNPCSIRLFSSLRKHSSISLAILIGDYLDTFAGIPSNFFHTYSQSTSY